MSTITNGENNNTKKKFEKSILDNFTKLTNTHEKIRKKSAVNLLKYLNENSEKKDENELKYAFTRLIRGLGSSKIQTRSGFYTTLVALLNSNLEIITIENVLECVSKELHKGGGNSKSENADIALGRILASTAVLRSNLFASSSNNDREKIIELILKSGKDRIYLNLASFSVLIDSFPKLQEKEIEKLILPELDKKLIEYNLDTLLLLIETSSNYPELVVKKSLQIITATNTDENLKDLATILMTIPNANALNHPIFVKFPKLYLLSSTNFDVIIVKFFNIIDENHLVKANRNKLHAAILLLISTLKDLKDFSLIPELLTKNLIQQIINNFKLKPKNKDKEFENFVYKLFDIIYNLLKNNQSIIKTKIKIKILKKLLFYPGTFIFEKITKSKLIQNITTTLNCNGVKKLGELYKEVIKGEKEKIITDDDKTSTEKWFNLDRIYASHLLVKLINHQAMREENDWKIIQLNFLLQIGLLKNEGGGGEGLVVVVVGSELAEAFKKTFYSSLDLKLTKLDDLRLILSQIVHNLNDNNRLMITQILEPEDYKIWEKTMEIIKKIEKKQEKKKKKIKKSNDDNNLSSVFHTLFLHLNLQLFNDSKLAIESLNELFICYEQITKKSTTTTDDDDDDNNNPLWIEVVIELFLYLLSHNSHLLRNVINCVFPHLCQYMNATALQQILSVLNNDSNPLSANDDNSSNNNSSEEEEEESSSSDNSDDDDERDNNNGLEHKEDDDDDDREDKEEDKETDQLRLALQKALNSEGYTSDQDSLDLDELDEIEGNKLDEALQQVFQQYRGGRGGGGGRKSKKQNKNDEILTHFRIRCLDLIEIYLNSNPSINLCLNIMLPLLQTLEFSIRNEHEKPLVNRVKFCLKKLTNLKKFNNNNEEEEEIIIDDKILLELMQSLLEKGTKNSMIIQEMAEKIAEATIFIIKCSQRLSIDSKAIAAILNENLEIYFNKRDCLIPYVLFKNILQLNWDGILLFIPSLINYVFDEKIRPFRRNQAIELLRIFYTNHRFFNNNHSNTKNSIVKYEKQFFNDTENFLKNFSQNHQIIKDKFVCNLFNLLNCIKSSPGHHSDIKWEKLDSYKRGNNKRKNFEKIEENCINNQNIKKKKKKI